MTSLSTTLIQDLYAHMLLTRLVDECAWNLHIQGQIQFVASCRGHEAAQVASALCIEVGKDFTLPYYRDLGVVLTLGMTPYEVLRTYLHLSEGQAPLLHWGYHKHNMVTGPAPVATQILHAAGIAFACKLRKADVVTVAYCGDSSTTEADFLEGTRFAALHQLPMIIICEQDTPGSPSMPSLLALELPAGLPLRQVDGSDAIAVYEAMQAAMDHARSGQGPLLLEIIVTRSTPSTSDACQCSDPLFCLQDYMNNNGLWDASWAEHLQARLSSEVADALQDVLHEPFPH